MTIYDLDTSGLIKRYVTEAGSSGVQQLFQDKQDHLFLTSRLTMPETYSAFARRLREGSVSAVDYQVNLQAFQLHSATSYRFIELTEEVVHISRRLLEQYPLRANDAVQLASALVAYQTLQNALLRPMIFLAADNRLLTVATEEGLLAQNPNEF